MFWGFRRRTSPVTTRVFVRQTSWPFPSQGRVEAAKLRLLTALILCLVALAMPISHAVNNVHTFYLGSSSLPGCTGKCEGLATSSGTADTGTSQSVSIGSSPALDSGGAPDRTGTWSSGSTFTITGLTTSGTSDVIILLVVTNPQSITVSTSTPPSASSGITFQATPRQTYTPTNCAARMEEWIGTTSAALSSVTTTITLAGGTPTAVSGQIIAYTGAKEPTGTAVNWAFDQASGFGTSSDQNSKCSGGGPNTPQLTTGVTTLNANDLVLGLFGSESSITETGGGSPFILRATLAATGDSNAIEDGGTSGTGSQTCPFGSNSNRWLVICDALQSAVKFYPISPDVASSTTTGTPSTMSPSGYAWVYNTAGIQSGLSDIFSGTWQFDMTVATSSTTPVGRLWITVWQCGTNSLGSCTFLFKNWDTSTNNVIGSTTATKYTWTSATQPTFSGWSGKYLAVEYWTVMQYSGSTSATTAAETTVSTASDIITPNWDSAQSLSGSLTLNSAEKTTYIKILSAFLTASSSLAEKSSIFRSLSGALTSASNLAEHTP